jgi:hypothetical protein
MTEGRNGVLIVCSYEGSVNRRASGPLGANVVAAKTIHRGRSDFGNG